MLFARFFVIAGALIVFITLFCDAVFNGFYDIAYVFVCYPWTGRKTYSGFEQRYCFFECV